MGRQAKHTQEQVFEEADRIAAAGQEVTATVLLQALGGSLTTIYKHLDAWQGLRHKGPAPAVFEMPEEVKAAFSRCWQSAAAEAAKEIAVIREKADADVKSIGRRFAEALANIERLEADADSDSAKFEALELEMARQRAAAMTAATEAAKREASLAATVAQMQSQIDALTTEFDRVHAEHESSRKEQVEGIRILNDEVARLRGKLDEEAQRSEVSAERERMSIAARAEAQANADRLTEQLKQQKLLSAEVIAKCEESRKKLEAQLSQARIEAIECATQLGSVSGQCDTLRSQVMSQETLIRELANRAAPGQSTTSKVGK